MANKHEMYPELWSCTISVLLCWFPVFFAWSPKMATAGEPKKQEILPFVYQYLKDICFDGATQLKKKFKVVSL